MTAKQVHAFWGELQKRRIEEAKAIERMRKGPMTEIEAGSVEESYDSILAFQKGAVIRDGDSR